MILQNNEQTETITAWQKKHYSSLPVFFVADRSESMGTTDTPEHPASSSSVVFSTPIEALNDSLKNFLSELRVVESEARLNLGFSLISFASDVRVDVPLQPLSQVVKIPTLTARGITRYEVVLELIHEQLHFLAQGETDLGNRAYTRPVIFFLTDGVPSDKEGLPLKDHTVWHRWVDKLKGLGPLEPRIYAIALGPDNLETSHLEYLVNDRETPATPDNRVITIQANIPATVRELIPHLAHTIINPQTGLVDPQYTDDQYNTKLDGD